MPDTRVRRYRCQNPDFLPHCRSIKKAVKHGLRHAIFTPKLGRYKGDWQNDKKEGEGTFLTAAGQYYEGEWLNGKRHGYGVLSYRLPDDTFYLEYRGYWVRGKPHGVGWRFFDLFNTFLGYWDMGRRTGYGKMWYEDGSYYVGYWKEDKKEGLGMMVYPNGNRYEGCWGADRKHGLGRYYHLHTGQLQEGVWVDGDCVTSKMADIAVRQFCDRPTPLPIPNEQLVYSRALLEESELWLKQSKAEMGARLKFCTENMVDL